MVEGIVWALFAGLMLGLYALPGKFTKNFKEENTWGLFFMLTMFVVPTIVTLLMMKGVGAIYGSAEVRAILPQMVVTSVLWGIGVMMWGKAIHHIGMSLGFSVFIGTVILVGSLMPFFVEGLPAAKVFATILIGLAFVLVGIVANGKAGMAREKDDRAANADQANVADGDHETKKSMGAGLTIAVVGGLLATGFSFANAVGRPPLHEASMAQGNPEWVTALAVMFPIFLSGGLIMAGYFAWQLTQKKAWGSFKTSSFGRNFVLIFMMAFFHYAASAVFAYAAFKLGAVGNTVGYAIFNTACVVTAIVSGLVVGEWKNASSKAKNLLYTGLGCMVIGILIIAFGNKLGAESSEISQQPETVSLQSLDSLS
ncbi:L-rhamnose/proton symporter RhaT [Novipirellula artificiosorum]|uniref:L-rhamnose-proton symporter n=1 Tax=Novipirellula artificiosorum TaxID=2528016 RepID=A0A5C6DNJ8_9BACT|nr:L-rhamnose/proton symporter RhaT [Novipirellula artificiosorum]TWU38420.1 L-rhamnose-proton symporter [Novipirellula artificiosorum]